MWQPDFPHTEVIPARLFGWHRAMCILSHFYRGTVECPGLVLGLDQGGSCMGMAFRVAAAQWPAVKSQLDERELINNVYLPKFLTVRLKDGRRVTAYAFVADRKHHQYWKGSRDQAIHLIAQGVGSRGRSREYLEKTLEHMLELGIADTALSALSYGVALADGCGKYMPLSPMG